MHLFTASRDLITYVEETYRKRSEQTSGLVDLLLRRYQQEKVTMPYTWDDFPRDSTTYLWEKLTPEEILTGLPAEERLKGLSVKERFQGRTPEEIRAPLLELRQDAPPPCS